MAQRIGVVLAGGEGRRLGEDKARLELGGRTLAERAASELWPLCGSVLISVRPGAPNPAPGFEAVPDAEPAGRGPLAGLAAAFSGTGEADLLILACDYPNVTRELMATLVEMALPDDDLVMVTDGAGRDHPLVALWRRSAEPVVVAALDHGFHKVGGVMADLRVRRLSPEDLPGHDLGRALLNVNTPEDLRRIRGAEAGQDPPPEKPTWAD